jgi:hypothetical protein
MVGAAWLLEGEVTVKRSGLVLLVGAVVAMSAACFPQPSSAGQLVTVGPIVVSATPVEAGSTFTVTVTGTDTTRVVSLTPYFVQPGTSPNRSMVASCDSPPFAHTATVTVTFTCTIADFALDGTWYVVVDGWDGVRNLGEGGTGGFGSAPFTVAGGSNDSAPPVPGPVVLSPDPVVAGAPFTVTLDATDDHPYPTTSGSPVQPLSYRLVAGGGGSGTCPATEYTLIGPTEQHFVWTCPASTFVGPGDYFLEAGLLDQNQNRISPDYPFTIVAGS